LAPRESWCLGREVGGFDDIGRLLKQWDQFPFAIDVISHGDRIGTRRDQFLILCDAKARPIGGIFGVGDHHVATGRLLQPGDGLAGDLHPWDSDDIPQERGAQDSFIKR
jgi:hypothetical protein